MRIVSMEKGDNVRGIIERFAKATEQIGVCLREQGYDFMRNDHLGWVLTCPSNLGTGLRAGAMVKDRVLYVFFETDVFCLFTGSSRSKVKCSVVLHNKGVYWQLK